MAWGLKGKNNNKQTVISLSESEIRLFLVERLSNELNLLTSQQMSYDSPELLQEQCSKWFRANRCKGLDCSWLLSRKLYNTLNIKPPKVPTSELDSAIKWLIKDQIEQPLEDILISHYQPFNQEQEAEKLTAVTVDKTFIENLINITADSHLELISIEIDELAAANTLAVKIYVDKQNKNKITGFIDEDKKGLIFNFYVGHSLAFTRHIKGRFFPIETPEQLSLEGDSFQAQQDQFLLETQRTLDYCVSQVFRKPVDSLILDASKTSSEELLTSLEQVAELPVHRVEATSITDKEEQDSASSDTPHQLNMSLAEAGAVFSRISKPEQFVNFYQSQYQPKPLEFGFKFAASIAAVFVLFFISYGYIQENQLNKLQSQLSNDQKKLGKIQLSLQQIQKEEGRNKITSNLEVQIKNKQHELIASKQLLSRVANKAPTQSINYSEILRALSKQTTDSLWLTKIKLHPDSISLSGQTTKPQSIPNYISSMAEDVILRSRFEEFLIERDDNDSRIVNFFMNNGHYQYAD